MEQSRYVVRLQEDSSPWQWSVILQDIFDGKLSFAQAQVGNIAEYLSELIACVEHERGSTCKINMLEALNELIERWKPESTNEHELYYYLVLIEKFQPSYGAQKLVQLFDVSDRLDRKIDALDGYNARLKALHCFETYFPQTPFREQTERCKVYRSYVHILKNQLAFPGVRNYSIKALVRLNEISLDGKELKSLIARHPDMVGNLVFYLQEAHGHKESLESELAMLYMQCLKYEGNSLEKTFRNSFTGAQVDLEEFGLAIYLPRVGSRLFVAVPQRSEYYDKYFQIQMNYRSAGFQELVERIEET